MKEFFDFFSSPAVLTPIGLALGYFLKRASWFNTKAIPVLNFLIAALARLVDVSVGGAPASVVPQALLPAVVPIVAMGFLDNWIVSGLLNAAAQTFLTTGIHGFGKNAREWLRAGPAMTVSPGDPRGK